MTGAASTRGGAGQAMGGLREPVRVETVATAAPLSPDSPVTPQLLRMLTCGSVDDGKSTLIGRLLYDCRALFADQLAAVEHASKRRGDEKIDLSLFTDGLRWEREQGITIDVAYRYFSTLRRRFILIDSPGHVQYTRNMVTGASHADLAVILVDARQGVQEQTHRHAYLAALVGIRNLVVAVNKMDLVAWERAAFERVRESFEKYRDELGGGSVKIDYVPLSALRGDNVVDRSASMGWYDGPVLLDVLESAPAWGGGGEGPARFPVQWVIRPRGRGEQAPGEHDYRGFAGRVASGSFKVGDRVVTASSGRSSTIASIRLMDQRLTECRPGQSVSIELSEDLDIGRGELLVKSDGQPPPTAAREVTATVVWMGAKPLQVGRKYLLRHGTLLTPAIVDAVESKLDLATLRPAPPPAREGATLEANDIGVVRVRAANELHVDSYSRCRATGSFVLIDEATHETAGAGIIRDVPG